jgi:hypothetical protein
LLTAPNISRRFRRDGASPIGGIKDSIGRRGMKDSIDSGELRHAPIDVVSRKSRQSAQSNVRTRD